MEPIQPRIWVVVKFSTQIGYRLKNQPHDRVVIDGTVMPVELHCFPRTWEVVFVFDDRQLALDRYEEYQTKATESWGSDGFLIPRVGFLFFEFPVQRKSPRSDVGGWEYGTWGEGTEHPTLQIGQDIFVYWAEEFWQLGGLGEPLVVLGTVPSSRVSEFHELKRRTIEGE